ncbi:MAG: hypothetical protein CAF41_001770 [Nitrospira sp. CG24A]|nr:MAG: hypothetical protein CAF41_001770 [Nitrospira sp. CG24A]
MRPYPVLVMLLLLVVQWGCSQTVLVPVSPRMDLKNYGTFGLVQFASNSDPAINSYATQQFQEQVQGAYPGTAILELGNRETVLAAVGAGQLDAEAITKIGQKYGVSAVFLGDITYSEPTTNFRIGDITKLHGGVRSEVRGDLSTKLMETKSGASVWSSSAWATRQIGSVSLSTKGGVNTTVGDANPRKAMVPALIYHVTEDFRPKFVRQKVQQ